MTGNGDSGYVRSRMEPIRKTLWTILIGGMTFIITNISEQPMIWQLMMSMIIGGITLLMQFLKDFDSRLERVEQGQEEHSGAMRSLIESCFARTSSATELFQAVEASALQTDAVIQLVRNSTKITPASPPLFYEFAQLQIDQTSEFLKELSGGGVVEYDGEDQDWILGLTMLAKNTIDATSLSAVDAGSRGFDGGLWTRYHGQRYLKLQREAMSRGVAIRRLFIVDRTEQISEAEFLRVYQQHKNLGIKVKVLDRSEPFNTSLFDFVVFDGALSYEVTPSSLIGDSRGPTIVKTHLILQSEKVRERMQRFEGLWASAHELETTDQVWATGS